MTRLLSILLLSAMLGSTSALADGSSRALLPMGGDVGYGSPVSREPVTTGGIGRRDLPSASVWSARGMQARARKHVGAPGSVGH